MDYWWGSERQNNKGRSWDGSRTLGLDLENRRVPKQGGQRTVTSE